MPTRAAPSNQSSKEPPKVGTLLTGDRAKNELFSNEYRYAHKSKQTILSQQSRAEGSRGGGKKVVPPPISIPLRVCVCAPKSGRVFDLLAVWQREIERERELSSNYGWSDTRTFTHVRPRSKTGRHNFKRVSSCTETVRWFCGCVCVFRNIW